MSSGSTYEPGFSAARLARLSEIERWHFWFVGRRTVVNRLVRKYLARSMRLMDIGCGTGCMLEELTRQGYSMAGLDLRPEGLHTTHQRLPQVLLLQARAVCLPLATTTFDAVLLLDVMEHVDDRSLLQEVGRILKPGGVVIVTVPALPWLWSYRDEAAGHLRRYTRQTLAALLMDAGFEIREMSYYQCLLLPLAILTRLMGRKDATFRDLEEKPFPMLNQLFIRINHLEAGLSRLIRLPWGSTLVAVCQK